MLIGGQDVLLPITMVGNYPNHGGMTGMRSPRCPRGEFIHDSISKEAFEDTVGAIVHDQEAAGLDVIADGRSTAATPRTAPSSTTTWSGCSGYRLSGPPIGLPIYSTLFSPTCVGEVRQVSPVPHESPARGAQGDQEAGQGVLHRPGVIAAATRTCTTRTPGNSPWPWPGRSTRTSRNSPTTAATSSSWMSSSGPTAWATGRSTRSTRRSRA